MEKKKSEGSRIMRRRCFRCNRDLKKIHFIEEGIESPAEVKRLEVLWESPYIQILCCGCKSRVDIEDLEYLPFRKIDEFL